MNLCTAESHLRFELNSELVPCQKVYKVQVKHCQKVFNLSKGSQVKRYPSQKDYKSKGPQSKGLQKSNVGDKSK